MTAPVLTPPATLQAEPAVAGLAIARALARIEARRLLWSPGMLVALALTCGLVGPWSFWPEVRDLRLQAAGSPFNLYLIAAATLVLTNVATLRGRRHNTEPLFQATPAPPQARTAAHLLSAVGPAMLSVVLVAGLIAAVWLLPDGFGRPDGADLAVGPLFVLGAGALGVLLARWIPSSVVAPVACVAIAAHELYFNNRDVVGSMRRLGYWVGAGELPPELLPGRLTRWHLIYLAGLLAMAAVGALVAHGLNRRLVVAGTTAILVVATSAWFQARPNPTEGWSARNALLERPQDHQVCEDRPGARFCAYPAYRSLVDYWARPVDGVRRVVPAVAWPAGLEVSQRVAANDRQYVTGTGLSATVAVLPAIDDPLPDDGSLHPPILWDTTGRAELGLALLAAARVVDLPLVPSSPEIRCDAAGQSRAVIALWLAGQASPATGAALRRLAHEGVLDLGGRPYMVMPDWGTPGTIAWGADEVGHALGLLRRPAAEVRTAIARDWSRLVDPRTPTSEATALLGLPAEPKAGVGPARSRFVGFGALDSGPVPELGDRCA
ncbi:MAG: hypothetical protein ABR540_03995 [Acidimicrobiales bacterium]